MTSSIQRNFRQSELNNLVSESFEIENALMLIVLLLSFIFILSGCVIPINFNPICLSFLVGKQKIMIIWKDAYFCVRVFVKIERIDIRMHILYIPTLCLHSKCSIKSVPASHTHSGIS